MRDKRKKRHRFLYIVGVGVVLVIIFALAFGALQQHDLEGRIAVARAAGFPFEGRDIEPSNRPAAGDNAAPLYSAAYARFRSTVFTDRAEGERVLFLSASDRTQAEWASLELYIREAEPIIADFVAASAMPGCYYEKEWEKGALVLIPEYGEVRQLRKLVLARAEIRAKAGDPRFLEDFAASVRCAAHIQAQPPLTALLTSSTILSTAMAAIQGQLSELAQEPKLLKLVKAELDRVPEAWDVTHHLKTEAYFLWWCGENPESAARAVQGVGMSHAGPSSLPFETRMAIRSQTLIRGYKSSVIDLFVPTFVSYVPFSDERPVFEALQARSDAIVSQGIVRGLLLNEVVIAFSRAQYLDGVRAKKRHLLAAVDVLEHHRMTGQWPTTLKEAGCELSDPYDDKPLRYKIDGAGFRVWSVGEDMSDDGGKTRLEASGGAHDEVLIYPPPKKQAP